MSKTSSKGKYFGTPFAVRGTGANCGKIKADSAGTPQGARRARTTPSCVGPLGPTHFGHIVY